MARQMLSKFLSAESPKHEINNKVLSCALVSIGLACSTQADQDNDDKEKKYRDKPSKVEAVDGIDKKDKEKKEKKYKGLVCDYLPDPSDPSDPVSVPDAGSTAALLGLALAVVGLTQRKWASSSCERP